MRRLSSFLPLITLKLGLTVMCFSAFAQKATIESCLGLMPCPQQIEIKDGLYHLSVAPKIFIQGMSEQRQKVALARLNRHLKKINGFAFQKLEVTNTKKSADIVVLVHSANQTYQLPALGDDESYQLTINSSKILLNANSEFGALQGLTTLVQLAALPHGARPFITDNVHAKTDALALTQANINDKPRFKWRGFLLDSSRHFMPVATVKRQLDGMAGAKLNVFHWHLTDDQGWRIESKAYPKLHQLASDNLYYSQAEIKSVVAYASDLGIRVVPEFDIPGHASAIAVAYPALMAEQKVYEMERHWGVFEPLLDVSNENVYLFVDKMVQEITTLFPDAYLHIGGDEVNPKQWQENADIQALMVKEGLHDSEDLHRFFNGKVQKILMKHQRKMMGWDEILHKDLPKDVVVQSWRGLESINHIAGQGYQALLSAGYYIDQPQPTSYHYRNDPLAYTNHQGLNKSTQINKTGHQTWQSFSFTMPRLKGSSVRGELTLITDNNNGVDKSDTATNFSAYLKLNDHFYKEVTLLSSLSEFKANKVVFNYDSWMGAMRFELDTSNSAALQGVIFVGNSYYPLVAKTTSSQKATVVNQINLLPLLSNEQAKNILGGEATLWAEMIDENNVDLRAWPRLFAIAERFWSAKSLTDSNYMYQRLHYIDDYAANVLGLQHKQQQQDGFQQLLNDNTSAEEVVNDIAVLTEFSQVLAPAQYYTRHHIKYQQNQYHQQAPLNLYVDYLAVESFSLLALKRQLQAYQQGNKSALGVIESSILAWQQSEPSLAALIAKHEKLADLSGYVADFKRLNNLGLQVISACKQGLPLSESQQLAINQQVLAIQSKQQEIVLATAPVIRELMASCQ
ncbi:family 20 glycosylhydrolase [Colwellia sp. D2M02]|uniref:beta-N-acetylhexosaminidase n=1 Tax=Colwellia sp. D2M02 TaxID=2841562 RepID=UPI001C083289|nr:family 20 glycosylhydrolase [Colwellia sp. D2M02]